MRISHQFLMLFTFIGLVSCSPVKMPVTNQYQLNAFSNESVSAKSGRHTLLVTTPESVAGYQTEAMMYVKKPYQLETFVKNAWIDRPANMLYPLLVQSLQGSGYFYAVVTGAYIQGADYRLDTQLLHLEQDFLSKPSVLAFAVKVVLTRVSDQRVIASRIISERIPCTADTPYGGVLAANKASLAITGAVTRFVVSSINRH